MSLLTLSLIISFGVILRSRAELAEVSRRMDTASAREVQQQRQIEQLKAALARGKKVPLHEHELPRLNLQDPVNTLVADLQKHNELIPYKGVLGGTMAFYSPEDIHVLSDRWVLAHFEDGHIGGKALLEYRVAKDGTISWTVIDSYTQ